ncbi:phospholipid scramblase 2-like isoform X2 [Littorina saxatilis]|uniref:phospholipid scramblase 2-like isoform X2 n=1 Tax=Littorina saxatilis TaxID=31220 RepID=UPI0038B5B90A
MAITSQPGPLHPALQYMGALDQVIVKQEVALLEVILPYEVGNKYSIFNTMNQRIFYAAEDSNWCCKQCCGPHRPFAMKITDNMGQPVLHIERPCNMGAFFPNWPCCSDSVIVNAETGDHFGTIERKCNPFFPGYRVLDHNQAQVMSMDGPCCCLLLLAAMCCQDQAFTVVNSDVSKLLHCSDQAGTAGRRDWPGEEAILWTPKGDVHGCRRLLRLFSNRSRHQDEGRSPQLCFPH